MKRTITFAVIALFLLGAVPAFAAFQPEVKVGGKVFFHYQYTVSSYDEEDPQGRYDDTDNNGFYLGRGYIVIKAKMHPAISACAITEVTRLNSVSVPSGVTYDEESGEYNLTYTSASVGGGYVVYMKQIYINFKIFPFFQIKAGIHGLPIVGAACRAWKYRYVQKDFTNLWHIDSTGIGVQLHGEFPGGYGNYALSVYNGEGHKNTELNSGKAVEFRVSVFPVQVVDAVKGLEVALFTRYDKDAKDAGGLDRFDLMYGGWLNYEYEINDNMGINVGGGAFMGTYTDQSLPEEPEDYTKRNYMTYSAWLKFRFYKGLAVFARYDMNDPNTANDEGDLEDNPIDDWGYQDETSLLIAGLSYQIHKSVEIAVDYQTWMYTSEWTNSDGDDVTTEPDSYVFVHMQWSY